MVKFLKHYTKPYR